MDPIPLRDLSRFGQVRFMSPETGHCRIREYDGPTHGVCLPYPRPISAVYVHDDRLWLRVGRRKWDIDDIFEVNQQSDRFFAAKYVLTMNDGTHERVKIRFPLGVGIFRIIDITHDEIDSGSEDIMKMFPYTASDGWTSSRTDDVASWKETTLRTWREEIGS